MLRNDDGALKTFSRKGSFWNLIPIGPIAPDCRAIFLL